jgi:hypothetical protein
MLSKPLSESTEKMRAYLLLSKDDASGFTLAADRRPEQREVRACVDERHRSSAPKMRLKKVERIVPHGVV